jgi:diguanylate cyclase (GGDEF)-like protein
MSLSIKYKASIPVILLAFALVSFTSLSIYFMGNVESITENLTLRHHELEQVQVIEAAASELVFPHLDYLTTRSPDSIEQANALFSRIEQQVHFLDTMNVVHTDERVLLDYIRENIAAAKQISQQIFAYDGNHHHHYMKLINNLSESHLVPIRSKLADWHAEEARDVNELNATAKSKLHHYLFGAAVVLALALAMVVLTLWFNNIILIRPLLDITSTTSQLATGDFSRKTTIHSQDELGKLAHNINEMALSLDHMYCELNNQARTDQLTGVLNRLSMEEILQRELAAANRNDQPFSIAVFDLDHFKTINDRYGHPVGDKVLQAVVEIVLRNIRRCDYCFRYGGEEFLLLFPNTNAIVATKVLERCRKAIEEKSLAIDSYKIPITASFGLAGYPDDGSTAESLITNADDAVYAAKNTGRNKIIDYSSINYNQLNNQAS